jgi:putative ABC transport system substrate-binding protein
MGVTLVAKPVNNSAELKLVTAALIKEDIDVFFANPDNVVFAGFETIFADCSAAGIPVFTSEAGLVARGAVAAYGPDLFEWGYQAGVIAAKLLNGEQVDPSWELVNKRISVYNPKMAEKWGLKIPNSFTPIE